jgi:predicted Ser/Thr protein kinase
MIKRKVKVKKLKCKNPKLEYKAAHILNNIDFEFLSEGNDGELYKFKLDRNTLFDSIILKPGYYILKLFKYPIKNLNRLKLLSDNGLIPKVYFIDSQYVIMKYIKAVNLYQFVKENKNKDLYDPDYIMDRLRFLISRWHKLGFAHGDLILGNILITKDYKIYLIDPKLDKDKYYEDDYADLEYLDSYIKYKD